MRFFGRSALFWTQCATQCATHRDAQCATQCAPQCDAQCAQQCAPQCAPQCTSQCASQCARALRFPLSALRLPLSALRPALRAEPDASAPPPPTHCGQFCDAGKRWGPSKRWADPSYRLSPRRSNLKLFLRSRVCFSGNQTWGDGKGCLRAAQNSLYHDLYLLPARAMPHDPPRHRPAAVRPEHHQCLIWGSQSSKSL